MLRDYYTRASSLHGSLMAFVTRYALAIVISLALLLLLIIGGQKACDNRSQRIENERIKQYEEEVAERLKIFQSYIDRANSDHRMTTGILDALSSVTKNINALNDNDKIITRRVNEIEETEYKQARTQKNNQAAVKRGTAAKSKKPIRTREIDALKADEELYPSN
jgi:hypothetical protein